MSRGEWAAAAALLLGLSGPLLAGGDPPPQYLPTDVQVCSAIDADINACFLKSSRNMIRHLVPGTRALGALPLDPLLAPFIQLPRGNEAIPTLAFNITDTKHVGLAGALITAAREFSTRWNTESRKAGGAARRACADPRSHSFRLGVALPRYEITGNYEVTGSVVGIPLEGNGYFNLTFIEDTYDILVEGHAEERAGRRHLAIDRLQQNSTIRDMVMYVDNLFGSHILSNVTNRLLNAASTYVASAAEPAMSLLLGEVHRVYMQRIFDAVPYDAFFTDLD